MHNMRVRKEKDGEAEVMDEEFRSRANEVVSILKQQSISTVRTSSQSQYLDEMETLAKAIAKAGYILTVPDDDEEEQS